MTFKCCSCGSLTHLLLVVVVGGHPEQGPGGTCLDGGWEGGLTLQPVFVLSPPRPLFFRLLLYFYNHFGVTHFFPCRLCVGVSRVGLGVR